MSDPRLTPDPAKGDLRVPCRVTAPVTDLLRRPDGPRDRQLIFGDLVERRGIFGDYSYVQSRKDGYCGYIANTALGQDWQPTHKISAPASHAYTAADLKSPETMSLSFASEVQVTAQTNDFAQTPFGFIPTQHLTPIDAIAPDPAAIAALFLGTPYLWGGNSRWGIDCSGLVQAALLACGHPCPGDSDQQMTLGAPASAPFARNDLLFWKGHVALVTDPITLIHANAGSMSTRLEPIADALTRIAENGDGPLTAHRRITLSA